MTNKFIIDLNKIPFEEKERLRAALSTPEENKEKKKRISELGNCYKAIKKLIAELKKEREAIRFTANITSKYEFYVCSFGPTYHEIESGVQKEYKKLEQKSKDIDKKYIDKFKSLLREYKVKGWTPKELLHGLYVTKDDFIQTIIKKDK